MGDWCYSILNKIYIISYVTKSITAEIKSKLFFLFRNNDNNNDNDNENMFSTIDLHIYRIQDARYQYTDNKHLTLFFLW